MILASFLCFSWTLYRKTSLKEVHERKIFIDFILFWNVFYKNVQEKEEITEKRKNIVIIDAKIV